MPLIKSKSDAAFRENVSRERDAGKPRAQALAIAYSVKRRPRADGGALTPFAVPAEYNTKLSPLDEIMFRDWVERNHVPFNPDAAQSDYDMRGFWQGLQQQHPRAVSGVDPNDQRMHFNDYWKAPTHERFSSESQWAGPTAPRWINDNQLAAPSGRVIFDDAAANADPTPESILRSRKAGGRTMDTGLALARKVKRARGGGVHVGPIISTVGGRTDKHAMSVPSGAYVIPADVVSGLKGAQGNTLAGMKILDHLFGPHGPYGSSLARMKHVHRAAGGSVDEPVPIMSAGGEQVIAPEIVQRIGKGNMDHGHRILDAFVKRVRSKNVKTLKNLPGPARD